MPKCGTAFFARIMPEAGGCLTLLLLENRGRVDCVAGKGKSENLNFHTKY
jgi:hypothetical protein